MIICFDCSPETKNYLDNLLSEGNYNDYGEIIDVAIRNLAVLHAEIEDQGTIFIDLNDSSIQRALHLLNASSLGSSASSHIKKAPHFSSMDQQGVPNLFGLRPPNFTAPLIVQSPLSHDGETDNPGLPDWIFGQYNRFLPSKVSCRGLANLIAEREGGIPLADAIAQIPKQATNLGDFLRFHDKKHSLSRDQSLSIAFPTSGPGVAKSELRFGNQFIASVDKAGNLSGMLFEFKFINWVNDKRYKIALTGQGWLFSQLMNPFLEGKQEFPNQKFSREEVEFLIKHIRANVQIEIHSYQTILSAIRDGYDTPSRLDNILISNLTGSQKKKYSKSFLSSQRSGAISRMIDLGLIQRVREGKYVRYKITDEDGIHSELLQS